METIGLYTNPNMILTGVEAENSETIIKSLCELALQNGYVDQGFSKALLEREKEYPTGLPTAVPIAIPHVHDGCLKSFFSMAVLKEPAAFRSMEDPEEEIQTRLIFLFGITDPSYQVEVLRKFSTFFQKEEALKELLEIRDSAALMRKMKEMLETYLIIEE